MAIANRIARVIYKVMGGTEYKDLGYMRGDPREDQIKKLVKQLKILGVDIKHESHQMIINSVKKVKVDNSGIIQEETSR